jgi:quinol monooxygenase YgiN
MDKRLATLQAFYGGSGWQVYHDQVKSMVADPDNVLLLRPARTTSAFFLDHSLRPLPGTQDVPPGLVVATILSFETRPSAGFLDWFEGTLSPVLANTGASILAWFLTEERANDFPYLPVREGEQVFVWFSSFRDQAAYDQHVAALARSAEWQEQIWEPLVRHIKAAPSVLKLTPTARSLIHG